MIFLVNQQSVAVSTQILQNSSVNAVGIISKGQTISKEKEKTPFVSADCKSLST